MNHRTLIVIAGIVIGAFGALLVKYGNPGNMGFCIACFERDITGAIGLHRAAPVQYIRPEIIGLMVGALLSALAGREFKARGGSSPLIRFVMGVFMMLGALVFLGCPLRDVLRMAGGDFNAVVGLAGFICGVLFGVYLLKRGFDLGRAQTAPSSTGGLLLPLAFVALFALLLVKPVFNPEAGGPLFLSSQGPGSMHAPILLSLGAGLLAGWLAQKTRLCLSGGFRDLFLVRDPHLITGFIAIFVTCLVLNLAFGFFKPGFEQQPIAHTMHLWNFLGLFLVGQCATLLGGCPLRQLILAGEGDMDGALVVLGMIVGAALAHNFMLAASPAGVTTYGQIACIVGIVVISWIGWSYREA